VVARARRREERRGAARAGRVPPAPVRAGGVRPAPAQVGCSVGGLGFVCSAQKAIRK
jgi:hypothetical protein